jgi:hypothetical protein
MAAAMTVEDGLGECLDRSRIRNVRDHAQHRSRRRPGQLVNRLVQQGFFHVGEHQVGTFGGKGIRQRAADAIGPAGDDDDLSGKIRDRPAHCAAVPRTCSTVSPIRWTVGASAARSKR